MDEKKQKSLKDLNPTEVIDAINNSKYYSNEIKKLEDKRSDLVVSGNENKKAIDNIDSRLQSLNKTVDEYTTFKRELDLFLYKLKELAKEQALLRDFEYAIYRYVHECVKYDYHKNEDITHDYHKNGNSTYDILMSKIKSRLHRRNIHLQRESSKISKEAYKKLKKNAKKYTIELTSLKFIIDNPRDNRIVEHKTMGIDEFVDRKTSYNIEGLSYSFYSSKKAEYSVFYGSKILDDTYKYNNSSFIGQDFDLLQQAHKEFYDLQRDKNGNNISVNGKHLIKDNELNSTSEGKTATRRLENLNYLMNTEIKGVKVFTEYKLNFSELAKLRERYEQIVNLSREVAGLNLVLKAFKDTELVDDEIYQIAIEIRNEQARKLYSMFSEAEKLYENVEQKMRKLDKINFLIEQLSWIKYEKSHCNDSNRIYELETAERKKQSEIINYLKEHPEINPKDYGYNFDVEEEKVEESLNYNSSSEEEKKIDEQEKIQKLKRLSDINSSNRSYYYGEYHDRKHRTGEDISFIEFLRSLNQDDSVKALIEIEKLKNEILEEVLLEYKNIFPEENWYNVEIFSSYCARSSKKDYFYGMDPFVTKLDIEDFIEEKIKLENITNNKNSQINY